MENEFPIAQRLLPADKLERWPQVCCVKITFGLLLTNPFISTVMLKNEFCEMPCKLESIVGTAQPHSVCKYQQTPSDSILFFL